MIELALFTLFTFIIKFMDNKHFIVMISTPTGNVFLLFNYELPI
jgi:hypothetical protein